MKLITKFASFMVLALASSAHAADDYDVLRLLLAKSSLVVAGEITSEPGSWATAPGVNYYSFQFKPLVAFAGTIPESKEFRVSVTRYEMGAGSNLPCLTKGGKCILFLQPIEVEKSIARWKSSDPYFGILPRNEMMENALEWLVRETKEAKEK